MAALAEREHYVVVGVDCTPASGALLRWADRQAMLIGARLVAVTGWRINLPGVDVASTVLEVETRTFHELAKIIRAALTPARARAVRRRVLDMAPADALAPVIHVARRDHLAIACWSSGWCCLVRMCVIARPLGVPGRPFGSSVRMAWVRSRGRVVHAAARRRGRGPAPSARCGRS